MQALKNYVPPLQNPYKLLYNSIVMNEWSRLREKLARFPLWFRGEVYPASVRNLEERFGSIYLRKVEGIDEDDKLLFSSTTNENYYTINPITALEYIETRKPLWRKAGFYSELVGLLLIYVPSVEDLNKLGEDYFISMTESFTARELKTERFYVVVHKKYRALLPSNVRTIPANELNRASVIRAVSEVLEKEKLELVGFGEKFYRKMIELVLESAEERLSEHIESMRSFLENPGDVESIRRYLGGMSYDISLEHVINTLRFVAEGKPKYITPITEKTGHVFDKRQEELIITTDHVRIMYLRPYARRARKKLEEFSDLRFRLSNLAYQPLVGNNLNRTL